MALHEERLKGLHPTFRTRLVAMIREAEKGKPCLTITQGLRTYAQQNALYAQGRTKPGKVVTNARGGYSWHNMSLAADLAFVRKGVVTWDGPWQWLGNLAAKHGLTWGGTFKGLADYGHFQFTGGLTLAQARLGRRPLA